MYFEFLAESGTNISSLLLPVFTDLSRSLRLRRAFAYEATERPFESLLDLNEITVAGSAARFSLIRVSFLLRTT